MCRVENSEALFYVNAAVSVFLLLLITITTFGVMLYRPSAHNVGYYRLSGAYKCDARAQNPSFIGNYLQRYKQK